jgi:WD40 repeat protein
VPRSRASQLSDSDALGALASATAVLNVDGRRQGTAVLVDERHMLTAAHLVTGTAGQISARFLTPAGEETIAVDVMAVSGEAHDVAVIELVSVPSPAPARLWPSMGLPREVQVFGYPVDDHPPRGVWRTSRPAGPVRGDVVQLDWSGDGGALPGHSGSPVVEAATGEVVGILTAGSVRGGFDRFTTLTAVRRIWTGLARPWLYAGGQARAHFQQRARGQHSLAYQDDLFRGRERALSAVESWLVTKAAANALLVVTGRPGVGKSAVVARAARRLEAERQMDGIAFHARRATIHDLVDAVCLLRGITGSSWQDVVARLASSGSEPLAVVVDALDEAASKSDLSELRLCIRELSRVPAISVVVATRRLGPGSDPVPGSLLHGLGITSRQDARLVDLDDDHFFDIGDLVAYSEAQLRRQGEAGRAWEAFERDEAVRASLADLIAQRAGRNFLVAGMTSAHFADQFEAVDPRVDDFDVATIPTGIGEALSQFLESRPRSMRKRNEALLVALAYAEGPGLDDDRWLDFANSLGSGISPDDIDALRRTPAADYLLETVADSGHVVTRLFHEALSDELRARRNQLRDQRTLLRALESEAASAGWQGAPDYVRRFAPAHAYAAGRLEELVAAPDFLCSAHPEGLGPHLRALRRSGRASVEAIYTIALPYLNHRPGHNVAALELVSQVQGNASLESRLRDAAIVDRPYSASGVLRPVDLPLTAFHAHTGAVESTVAFRWPGVADLVVASASHDGTCRVWNPNDPSMELARFDRHKGPLTRVSSVGWPGLDHHVIVTTSRDGTARIWDPLDPGHELATFDRHDGWVLGAATLRWAGLDHHVVVTTSRDGTARIWDPLDPGHELAMFTGHFDAVVGVAAMAWPGRPYGVVATTSYDSTVRIWDPQGPETELARFDGHTNWVLDLTLVAWPGLGHAVIASTSYDDTVCLWDPHDPGHTLARYGGHTNVVASITATTSESAGNILMTSSFDGTVHVWSPSDAELQSEDYSGHTGAASGITCHEPPGLAEPWVATSSFDGTARVWRVDGSPVEVSRYAGHAGRLRGITSLRWPTRSGAAVATASDDATAHVWDPETPEQAIACFSGHTDRVRGILALDWPGRTYPVVITTSYDATARVWDPADPDRELARFDLHDDVVWHACTMRWPGVDHDVVITTSDDCTARVWDPLNPADELARFERHEDRVREIATLPWPGLGHAAAITTSWDGTARIWDPLAPDGEITRFDGHAGAVWGVSVLHRFPTRRPLIATTSVDGTLRIWDPQRAGDTLVAVPLMGAGMGLVDIGTGIAVATSRGVVVVSPRGLD